MPLSHTRSGGRHDRGIASIGQRVNDLARWVKELQAVSIVAQTVAYAAICDESYGTMETWEVVIESRPCGDHCEAARREEQAWDAIRTAVVGDYPAVHVDCAARAVDEFEPLVGSICARLDGIILHLIDHDVGLNGWRGQSGGLWRRFSFRLWGRRSGAGGQSARRGRRY